MNSPVFELLINLPLFPGEHCHNIKHERQKGQHRNLWSEIEYVSFLHRNVEDLTFIPTTV